MDPPDPDPSVKLNMRACEFSVELELFFTGLEDDLLFWLSEHFGLVAVLFVWEEGVHGLGLEESPPIPFGMEG